MMQKWQKINLPEPQANRTGTRNFVNFKMTSTVPTSHGFFQNPLDPYYLKTEQHSTDVFGKRTARVP